jgi:tRNA(Arg) A34 adenosine deaminase TadA
MTVDGRPQSGRPCTRHAETNVVRVASERFDPEFLQGCTVYTSTEPCAICAGAIFWAKVRRVMFVLSEQDLRGIAGGNPENHDSGDLLSGDLRSRRPQGRSQRSNTCGSRHERCTRASGPDRPSARRAAHASTDEAVHRFSFAAATHSTGRRIHEGSGIAIGAGWPLASRRPPQLTLRLALERRLFAPAEREGLAPLQGSSRH